MGLVNRNLKTIFTRIAAAGKENGDAVATIIDNKIAAGHKHQFLHVRAQTRQRRNRLRALQCQERLFWQWNYRATAADFCLDVGYITHLARAIDDDENLIRALFEEHQIVDDATFIVQQ